MGIKIPTQTFSCGKPPLRADPRQGYVYNLLLKRLEQERSKNCK